MISLIAKMIKAKTKSGMVHLAYEPKFGTIASTYCGRSVEVKETYNLDMTTLTCKRCIAREREVLKLRGE